MLTSLDPGQGGPGSLASRLRCADLGLGRGVVQGPPQRLAQPATQVLPLDAVQTVPPDVDGDHWGGGGEVGGMAAEIKQQLFTTGMQTSSVLTTRAAVQMPTCQVSACFEQFHFTASNLPMSLKRGIRG